MLLLAAGLVHAAMLLLIHYRSGSITTYAFQSLDAGEYYQIARNLAEHGVFSQSTTPPLQPDTWRTPGYPLLLALPMWLMGELGQDPAALILLNQLLAVVNVLLLYKLACTLTPHARWIALLYLIEPFHLYYTLWLLGTTLFTTLLLLLALLWRQARYRQRRIDFLGAGGLAGLLILVWPLAVLVPVVLLLDLLVQRAAKLPAGSRPVPRFRGLLLLLGLVVVLAPWLLRNQQVAGHAALSHQSGIVLAYFKAAEVRLWNEARTRNRYRELSLHPDDRYQPHAVWETIDEQLRSELHDLPPEQLDQLHWYNLAQGNTTTVDSFVISAALHRIGTRMLLDKPLNTFSCFIVRMAANLIFPLDLAITPPHLAARSRLRDALIGTPYALLCLWIVFHLLGGRTSWPDWFFTAALVGVLLLIAAPQIEPRFRVPLIPFLLLLAAWPVPVQPPSTKSN
ncbi:MAG: hypothetical protein HJJLKODD_00823 [Phycisphaerae bacterium]|nr:hypothetical protein [Phycisphaerae bacterium]